MAPPSLAEFAVKELKGKRLALVAHDDDYGKANVATIRAVAARLGVQLVAAESISPRVTDVTAPMLNIRAANPDVIISTAYPGPAVLITQKYAEFGMTKEKIPLFMFWLGTQPPSAVAEANEKGAALPSLHSPFFKPIPEPSIETGVKAMTSAVMGLMKKR